MSSMTDTEGFPPESTETDAQHALEKEPSAAGSVWISESMSTTREVLFIAVVCLAQFCTRKCRQHITYHGIS